jgi:hypothetical protein
VERRAVARDSEIRVAIVERGRTESTIDQIANAGRVAHAGEFRQQRSPLLDEFGPESRLVGHQPAHREPWPALETMLACDDELRIGQQDLRRSACRVVGSADIRRTRPTASETSAF